MAYVKLVLAAIFLATIFIFPMEKVEACPSTWCKTWDPDVCGDYCTCLTWGLFGGNCVNFLEAQKMIEEHPNLCQSHMDCIKKKSGSFCALYPNSKITQGWCFSSNVEAKRYFDIGSAIENFLESGSKSYGKGFLKMPVENIAA